MVEDEPAVMVFVRWLGSVCPEWSRHYGFIADTAAGSTSARLGNNFVIASVSSRPMKIPDQLQKAHPCEEQLHQPQQQRTYQRHPQARRRCFKSLQKHPPNPTK